MAAPEAQLARQLRESRCALPYGVLGHRDDPGACGVDPGRLRRPEPERLRILAPLQLPAPVRKRIPVRPHSSLPHFHWAALQKILQ
jgi:hypothetical protein